MCSVRVCVCVCVCVLRNRNQILVQPALSCFSQKWLNLSHTFFFMPITMLSLTQRGRRTQKGRQKQENKRNEKFNLCNKEVDLEQLQNSLFLQFSACTRQMHYQFILNSNLVKLLNRIPKIFYQQDNCMINIILLHCTTTRMLWFVVFLCKLRLLFFKPQRDHQF